MLKNKHNPMQIVDKGEPITKFYEIRNKTETSADLYFYGDIVSSWWGAWDETDQYPEAIRDFLKEVQDKDLDIYINSAGGNVFAGLAIYNMLKRHKNRKVTHVDGIAASISSVIAFAGDEIIVPSNAFLMIHKPWNNMIGNANDFRKMADDLDILETGILNVYAENLVDGVELSTISQMMAEEKWMNGIEASQFFKIKVTEEQTAAAYASEMLVEYKNVPESIKDSCKVTKNQGIKAKSFIEGKVRKENQSANENNNRVDIALAKMELEFLI